MVGRHERVDGMERRNVAPEYRHRVLVREAGTLSRAHRPLRSSADGHGAPGRRDNDYQVLLQYDASGLARLAPAAGVRVASQRRTQPAAETRASAYRRSPAIPPPTAGAWVRTGRASPPSRTTCRSRSTPARTGSGREEGQAFASVSRSGLSIGPTAARCIDIRDVTKSTEAVERSRQKVEGQLQTIRSWLSR